MLTAGAALGRQETFLNTRAGEGGAIVDVVPPDHNVCSYCHLEIEPTFINPVRIELVTRDEEGEAVFYAHAACVTEHLPAEMSRYVEGLLADDVTPTEFQDGPQAK